MASCKECIHHSVCEFCWDEETCNYFDNQSDFQEVKQGKWEDKWSGKFANPTYICSVCKESAALENYIDELFTTHQRQKLSLFCPSCGAKMGDDKK